MLGVEGKEFLSSYKSVQNKTLPVYNFPKREAMLMATSYGNNVQIGVMSSWDAAEDLIANEELSQPFSDLGYNPKLSTTVYNMNKTYDNLCDDIKVMTKVEMGVIIAALAQHVREACEDAGHTFKGLDDKLTAGMLLSAMQDYKKLAYMFTLRVEAERSTYKGMTLGGQVYVIKFDDGHIKVGKSCSAESRIKCIAGSNQSKVLDYWISDRFAGYHEIEKLAHTEFSVDRKGGEFFTTSYEEAIKFVKTKVAENLINEIIL